MKDIIYQNIRNQTSSLCSVLYCSTWQSIKLLQPLEYYRQINNADFQEAKQQYITLKQRRLATLLLSCPSQLALLSHGGFKAVSTFREQQHANPRNFRDPINDYKNSRRGQRSIQGICALHEVKCRPNVGLLVQISEHRTHSSPDSWSRLDD